MPSSARALSDTNHRATYVSARTLRIALRGQWLYIAFLFCVNVWRAAHQSIAGDEAWVYKSFLVQGHFENVYQSYDAANHVLHTIACHFALKWFGLHDFAFRIPSLLGGLLYLVGCLRLCGWAFPNPLYSCAALAWLTLNPFLLDYMVAARGYGLALALFTWTFYYAARTLVGPKSDLQRVGYLSGLCVGANLVFTVPLSGLILALSALWISRAHQRGNSLREASWQLLYRVVVPAAVLFVVIDLLPLSSATAGHFYYGARSAPEMAASLVDASLRYRTTWMAKAALGESLLKVALWCAVHALLLVSLTLPLAAIELRRFLKGVVSTVRVLLLLALFTGAETALALWVGHHFAHVLLPLERTGIYIVFLFGIYLFAAAYSLRSLPRAGRALSLTVVAVLSLQTVAFGSEWNTRYFNLWRYDAGTRTIAQLIRQRGPRADGTEITIGTTWLCETALNYYRQQFKISKWSNPVTRDSPDNVYDYYVLLPSDYDVIEKRHLHALYRNPDSEAILAIP